MAGFSNSLLAQINSPYSRYGLGDAVSGQNVANRGMGNISAAFSDVQSINFNNPASYARLKVVTFDVGVEYENRRLRESNTSQDFRSSYITPSYLQVGIPISKKKIFWGMNLGLRPLTRINYNLFERTRIPGIDSVEYKYVGNGGSYQTYLGTGVGGKYWSVGVNAGYMFGNKQYNTLISFSNDTISYQKANYADTTRFGDIFLQMGAQVIIPLNKKSVLKLGAYGQLENNLNAKRDLSRITFDYDANSGIIMIDSVYRENDEKGTVVTPAVLGVGIIYEQEDKFLVGVDYTSTKWSQYSYYNQPDAVQDTWRLHVGAQYTPDITGKKYWSRVTYRLGGWTGPDYITINNNLNQWAVSAGLGLPIRRNVYTNQYTVLNTSMEWGARGSKQNSLRENFFRLSVGFCLSDIWFLKTKYD
jgi:hypothetical protein